MVMDVAAEDEVGPEGRSGIRGSALRGWRMDLEALRRILAEQDVAGGQAWVQAMPHHLEGVEEGDEKDEWARVEISSTIVTIMSMSTLSQVTDLFGA